MNDHSQRERLTPSSGLAPFMELAAGVQSAALAPSFVLGGWRASLARAYFGDVETLPVGCYELRGGAVTSHGLVLCDRKFLLCDQLNISDASIAEAGLYGPLVEHQQPARMIDGPAVSLAGPGHLIYGHWLVDFLPKLFVLSQLGWDPLSMRYLLPANTPGFALEWLRILGIRDEQFVLYSPYQESVAAERLIVPTLMRTSSRAHPLFAEAARYLLALAHSRDGQNGANPPSLGETNRRILISRASAGRDGRRMVNRAAVEQVAIDAGFTSICPERLSIREQIALFAGAQQIVGEYGSGLHGSMFSPPGTFVCALRAGALHPGFLQSGICQVMEQKIGYVFGGIDHDAVIQAFALEMEDVNWALRLLQIDASESTTPAIAPARNGEG